MPGMTAADEDEFQILALREGGQCVFDRFTAPSVGQDRYAMFSCQQSDTRPPDVALRPAFWITSVSAYKNF